MSWECCGYEQLSGVMQVRYISSVGGGYVVNMCWFVGGICHRRMRRLPVFSSSIGRSNSHGWMAGVCRVVVEHEDLMHVNNVANQVSITVLSEMDHMGGAFHQH